MTVTFGIQAAPTSWEPESDQRMYDDKERRRLKPIDPRLTAAPVKAKATTVGD